MPSARSDSVPPRRRLSLFTTCILIALLLAPAGCGFGTAGVVAGSGSGGGGAASGQSVGSTLQAPRSATSPATILFVLNDQEGDAARVRISFRQGDGSSYRPITLAAGSNPLTNVRSGPDAYAVLWDFAADLGGEGYVDGISLRLEVEGGISPPPLEGVTQGNDAPTVLQAEPALAGQPEYSGNTDIRFVVADSAADLVTAKVEYNDDAAGGFPANSWKLARPAATSIGAPTPEFAVVGAATSPGGQDVTFRWDSVTDLPGFDGDVRLRLTPTDGFASGQAFETATFRVDNNLPPEATLEGVEFALSVKNGGNIPIPFLLSDPEGDQPDVLLQWRAQGAPFPTLPTSASDLRDLLQNPDRDQERRSLQLLEEAPPEATGRTAAAAGLSSDQLRLPELAGPAAFLIANGILGRTLELLRQPGAPAPVVWSPNPCNGPVAAIPTRSGTAAFVLDSSGSGWRLRELELETGEVLRQIATGPGAPKGLTQDPSATQLFVASDLAVVRFDAQSGAGFGAVLHMFTDGPRGLAAIGSDVVIASGDAELTRLDFSTSSRSRLLGGLSEPWGVAVDPVYVGRIYFSERAANRVSSMDLGHLVPQPVAATVATSDVSALGVVPFPSPRALATTDDGRRLLVITQFGALASLRQLELRSPYDVNTPTDGVADPHVQQVTQQLGEPLAQVACGEDDIRIVSLPAANRLAISGGTAARRTIVAPYDAARQVVSLDAPVSSPAGTRWRLRTPWVPKASVEGSRNVFVWESRSIPDPAAVQVRIVPIDADIGSYVGSSQFLPLQPTMTAEQTVYDAQCSGVAAGDLDADGDTDFAFAAGGDVKVILQVAPDTFGPATTLPTSGVSAKIVQRADLDGDGDVDLLVGGNDGVVLYYQSSPGVFTLSGTSLPLISSFLSSMVTADIDADGDVDVVVGISGGAGNIGVILFRQIAPGTFATINISSSISADYMACADVDGDGDLDLAVYGASSTFGIQIYRQAANGEFTAAPFIPNSSGQRFALRDLDGDGDVDFAVANGNILPIWQTSAGVFEEGSEIPTPSSGFTLAAADLDGDGDVDLVSGSALVFQTSSGQFTAATSLLADLGADFLLADVDGDGAMDLVTFGAALRVNYQTRANQLRPAENNPILANPQSMSAADLDGDGDTDLAIANGGLRLFLQTAPGTFNPAADVSQFGGVAAVATADLNGDGAVDVVAARPVPGGLLVYLQIAPGTFAAPLTLPASDNGDETMSVTIADLDADGDLDLASVTYFGRVDLFLQGDDGNYEPAVNYSFGLGGRSIDAADLDGDGDNDLVASTLFDGLKIRFQNSPGVFGGGPTLGGGSFQQVVATDVDGDGATDVVGARDSDGAVVVFYQTSPGVFGSSQTLASGAQTYSVAVQDLDGDGDLDLVAANRGDANLTVFYQVRPRSFARSLQQLSTRPDPRFVITADLDQDGDPDIVTASPNGGGLSIFFGGR